MTRGSCVGVDLGATKTEIAVLDADARVLASRRCATPREPEAAVRTIAGIVSELGHATAGPGLPVVGVGVAGQVDPETGTLRYAPNLGWRDYPLRSHLEEALGPPVEVINDVQAAAYAEWLHGAGAGEDHLVAVFVGTGIGGGVISAGRLLRGSSGCFGEIGHMTVDLRGPRCHCGRRGCLEALAGGWALAEGARRAVRDDPAAGAALLAAAGGSPSAITGREIVAAAAASDPLAVRILAGMEEALGAGLASLANVLNPSVIVLGGGVIEGSPRLVERLAAAVRREALPAAANRLRVVRAKLGPHAVVIGAASLARVARSEAPSHHAIAPTGARDNPESTTMSEKTKQAEEGPRQVPEAPWPDEVEAEPENPGPKERRPSRPTFDQLQHRRDQVGKHFK